MSSRLTRSAPLLLAGVLPAALLCIGIGHVILNHFFSHAPYLLDSGWYSDIVYRAGLAPRNPQIACDYADWYFGVHFSPFISVFSIASYVVPLDRIEWYAVFQAICFLPFGVATYMLASRIEPQISPRRLPITIAAAIAFAFNGQILRMVTYPHYEGAIAGFGCLVLVALVTSRIRLAWILFAIAISVREDAGFHTALAIAPLLYLQWRGVEMSPSRRTVVAMIAIAIGSSVLGSLCQKLVFHGPSVMTIVYLGEPIYGHLSWSVIGQRAQNFFATCQVMYYPFIATCVVAAIKRDVRYLLGWAAGLPWFVLNFLAAQEQKATFEAYSGFPYIVSIFWVYLYGAKLAPATRRFRPVIVEAMFIAICLLATLG
ncbi:MAG TPA: hypothetical protein VGO00_21095, partial [Kofleriaceae bacterium]|nr:hypothetical protein [Kofleriaceae bacterium]